MLRYWEQATSAGCQTAERERSYNRWRSRNGPPLAPTAARAR
jgi:hypothetical protein